MVPTRRERTELIARERRQQILDAALDVFARRGFGSATTAEIAAQAGVSEGTLFKYFRSKRELFIDVIKNFIITGQLMDLIDRLPGGDIKGTLNLIMQDRLKLIESGLVSRVPMLMADVIRDPELKSLWVSDFLQPFFNKIVGVYRQLSETGEYRDIDPDVTVRFIGGMIIGFILLKTLEGDASPLEGRPQEDVTKHLVDFMLHGLLDQTPEEKGKR